MRGLPSLFSSIYERLEALLPYSTLSGSFFPLMSSVFAPFLSQFRWSGHYFIQPKCMRTCLSQSDIGVIKDKRDNRDMKKNIYIICKRGKCSQIDFKNVCQNLILFIISEDRMVRHLSYTLNLLNETD